ncbi:aldehyde dehydrogenase [Pseudonocardia xishanensis]|uniref:aldehyde dehydrogenase n=1 Tax=Pseudonocardia xishanensis TaxID=630995 RepID=UPI0031EE3B31
MSTYDEFYIGGGWERPRSRERNTVRSPNTRETVGEVPAGAPEDIDAAVAAARRQFDDPAGWSRMDVAERAAVLHRFADEIAKRAGETATAVSTQNGMPIAMAMQVEAVFPEFLLRYFADLARDTPVEERRPGVRGGTTVVTASPVGVVAAIVPWNGPQTQSMLKVAPALAAGCCVVLKPAPETVLDAYLTAQAAEAAGLPPGVLNVVPGNGLVGAHLVGHPGVDKVSFTGSTRAGREIGETCGRLIRPVTLELGGKSASIVLDDADLSSVADAFFDATLALSGQICHLGTRVLAPRSRYREIVDFVSDLASSAPIGSSLDPGTRVGPLVSERQRSRVESYIARGVAEGGRITVGGRRPDGMDAGWFVEPTVFTELDNSTTLAREEIFGPVLTVIPYSDTDEAIAIANDSDYGLGGTVWTTDEERGEAVAKRVETGTIGVNFYANDPGAPFGGVKASGIGREFGPEGLRAVQTLKSIYRRS